MASTEDYLLRIEQRLSRLEALIDAGALPSRSQAAPDAAAAPAPLAAPPVASSAPVTVARPVTQTARPRTAAPPRDEGQAVTQLMGWAGAALLVLAAAYLIRLVYDTGWFTPGRQVLIASLAGAGLVVAGLRLRHRDAAYASLLPAAGLAVIFLAIYGAHLVYGLVGWRTAAALVVANCVLALWLGSVFALELYVFFAVVGSYSAPLLLHAAGAGVTDLALYFSAWSLVFSTCAVMTGSRRPYLLAGYMALVAFAIATDVQGNAGWLAVVIFQSVQFAIFLVAAVAFSVYHEEPMTRPEGVVHLPLLLLFYALQYAVLKANVPETAPWVALASVVVLWAGYALARSIMRVRLEAGAFIVAAYTALVLFHAAYLELVPDRWAPAVALLLLPIAAAYAAMRPVNIPEAMPFKLLIAVVLALNYVRVLLVQDVSLAGGTKWLTFGFALEAMAAYFVVRRDAAMQAWAGWLLWAGLAAAMRLLWLLLGGGLPASTAWAVLALATLALAFGTRDQILGRASLVVFAACLAKLVLLDLAGAQPLVRIGSLVVVGIALYVGGAIYKGLRAFGAQPAGA